ncbi:hypothetical protein PIB30_054554 [Stylosanthes scabra]|uniref:Uncharacterized protein n=1 Tax=Stylosanthes scabra TaxID=79078 RepID=A0ABU6RJ72_9FABA|nr:hypothetical protein [Stylosanthes scabra]
MYGMYLRGVWDYRRNRSCQDERLEGIWAVWAQHPEQTSCDRVWPGYVSSLLFLDTFGLVNVFFCIFMGAICVISFHGCNLFSLRREAQEERNMETTNDDPSLVNIMDRLQALTDLVIEQRRLLEFLLKKESVNVRTRESNTGASKSCGKKGNVVVDPVSQRTRSKGKLPMGSQVEECMKSSPPMKRKLDFSKEEVGEEVIEIKQEGRGTPFTFHSHDGPFMIGEDMPHCFALVFQPPEGIRELAVSAFIFSVEEILVPDDYCVGSREYLQTLCPGRMVVDDVLNLVVSMYTETGKLDGQRIWWLPTTFAQIALSPISHCAATLAFIKQRYMGFAKKLTKDEDFYSEKRSNTFIFGLAYMTFLNLNMDCGVYVAQWMIQSDIWQAYNLVITDETRMRLGIDLVTNIHNINRVQVADRAVDY